VTGRSVCPILQGGIIAAGKGRRLRADGFRVSKPMLRVAGRPLIDYALDRFRAVGIRRLTVIINDASDDCREWIYSHAGDMDVDLVVRTTPSSYASFQLVADRLSRARAVITTVDGIMPTEDFHTFLTAAAGLPKDAVVLGVTAYVDDENPLWATLDPANGRIRQLGGDGGSHVTAGLYVLPGQRPPEPTTGFHRLRDYLGWLVAQGLRVHGVVLPRVFDIDRISDIAAAERAAPEGEDRSNSV
jgi:NDP-sugar pyrophosphorylase family protein